MKFKRKIQLLALFLAVIFIGSLSACSCSVEFDFSKIRYEAYNYEEITAFFDEAEVSLATTGFPAGATNTLNRAYNYLVEVETQYQMIDLEYNMDMSNAFSKTERTRVVDEYRTVYSRVFKLYGIALDNKRISQIFGNDEEFKAYIRQINSMQDADYLKRTAEITEIENEYDGLYSSVSVKIGGVEYNSGNLSTAPSAQRSEIYNAFYKEYSSEAGELLLKMRDKYNDMTAAKFSGYDSYADFAYEMQYLRDYKPSDAKKMTDAVKNNFKGYYNKIAAKAALSMQSASQSALIKTSSVDSVLVKNYTNTIKTYLKSISNDMLSAYEYMDSHNLYRVATGSSAYTGAYASYLSKYNAPFIYQYIEKNNINGSVSDISTFIHEFGHFYAFYKSGTSSIPLDIAEIQSQANEWLFMPNYKYIASNPTVYELEQLASSIMFSVQMGCIFDEFQQRIYADKDGTVYSTGEDVTGLFAELLTDYGAYLTSTAYDFKYWWANVPHTFSSPFYYISYAVSMLPSLEIYQMSVSDRSAAITAYNKVIDKGDEMSFTELLGYVSLPSPFTSSTIENLAGFIKSNWSLS